MTGLERDKVPESWREVYDALKGQNNVAKNDLALQKRCHEQYDLMFKNDKDPLYLEVSSFCVKVSDAKP